MYTWDRQFRKRGARQCAGQHVYIPAGTDHVIVNYHDEPVIAARFHASSQFDETVPYIDELKHKNGRSAKAPKPAKTPGQRR